METKVFNTGDNFVCMRKGIGVPTIVYNEMNSYWLDDAQTVGSID